MSILRPPRAASRRRTLLVALVGSLLLLGVIWLAVHEVAVGPADPLAEAQPVSAEARQGRVGRALPFVAVGSWTSTPTGVSSALGTVTALEHAAGDQLVNGGRLYRVDERPVVAVAGSVPWFRGLSGGERGRDVEQLQAMLAETGFLGASAVDGWFAGATIRAVRRWQTSIGLPVTGQVGLGDVVTVPELPARVRLSAGIKVGARLAGGEVAVERLPAAPEFYIPVQNEQVERIPLDATVTVTYADGVWEGRVGEVIEQPDGQVRLSLTALDGSPLCGDDCLAAVDLNLETRFAVDVQVVPEAEGIVVPVSALVSDPAGRLTVELVSGEERSVSLVQSSGGVAVVTGLREGESVLLHEPSEATNPSAADGRSSGGAAPGTSASQPPG